MAYTKIENSYISNSTLNEPGGGVLQLSMDGVTSPRMMASIGDGSNLNSLEMTVKIDSMSLETNEWCGVGFIFKDLYDGFLFAGLHSRAATTLYAYGLSRTWNYTGSTWYSTYGSATYSTPPLWLKVRITSSFYVYTSNNGIDWYLNESYGLGGAYLNFNNITDIGLGIHTLYGIESDDTFSVQFSEIKFDYNNYSPNLIPDMTSNTTPSGVASASSIANSSNDAWYAFNRSISDKWTANGTTGWLAYEFKDGEVYKIVQYTIVGCVSGQESYTPKNWTFDAWNGSGWDNLDTQSDQIDWLAGEKRSFPVSNDTEYNKYRINITANNGNGSYLTICEFEMMVDSGDFPLREIKIGKSVNYAVISSIDISICKAVSYAVINLPSEKINTISFVQIM